MNVGLGFLVNNSLDDGFMTLEKEIFSDGFEIPFVFQYNMCLVYIENILVLLCLVEIFKF